MQESKTLKLLKIVRVYGGPGDPDTPGLQLSLREQVSELLEYGHWAEQEMRS